jgi:hypothetical protein
MYDFKPEPDFEGIVYLLSTDGSLGYRSKQYLDNNPTFFSYNYHTVEKAWRVNSLDVPGILRMLQDWKVLAIDAKLAEELLSQLGLTRDYLRTKKAELGL